MLALMAIIATFAVGRAEAGPILFDQDVTPDVIFGSGNANGSFTVHRSGGVELGLRGKLRFNAGGQPENTFNSNGDGTYSFAAGVAPTKTFPTAVWCFEWTVNTDWDGTGGKLDDLVYVLGIDSDPTAGTSFVSWDPIADTGSDHAIGTNSTGNCDGVSATSPANYLALIGANNVAQNSWQPHWFMGGAFDPTIDATYDFYLEAWTPAGTPIARTEMQIIVGNGAAIPEPGTLTLLGLGAIGLAVLARRRRLA